MMMILQLFGRALDVFLSPKGWFHAPVMEAGREKIHEGPISIPRELLFEQLCPARIRGDFRCLHDASDVECETGTP
jgi:hypothetical protein